MLLQYKTAQLQQVVEIISKAVVPEKIFLLGAAQHCRSDESIFTAAPVTRQQIAQYSLLVLTREHETRSFDALQELIEGRCRQVTPVTVIIEAMSVFNQWIDGGHPFAVQVAVNGLLLYDKGDVALHLPPEDFCGPYHGLPEKDWTIQVAEYMAGMELYWLRKQFGLAAFLLHQAAEQTYTILMRAMTGYRPNTHNLDKLHRYCMPFSAKLAVVFPRNNERENHLFQLLQKAYVHGRYREDFVVQEKELKVLMERVQLLQELAKEAIEARFSDGCLAVV